MPQSCGEMEPGFKVIKSVLDRGSSSRVGTKSKEGEGIGKMRERLWNCVTKPSARRRYALISRAKGSGGRVRRTMKKRWMQKRWRRRKKKRQRHNQPQGTDTAVSSCIGSGPGLIREHDCAEERAAVSLSPILFHLAPSSKRATRQASSHVSPASRARSTVQSSRSTNHSAWRHELHQDRKNTRAVTASGHSPHGQTRERVIAETSAKHARAFRFRDGLSRKCNSLKTTSNPFHCSKETHLHRLYHTIFTGTASVSYRTCRCDKKRAPSAKHSCSIIYSPVPSSRPTPLLKFDRHTDDSLKNPKGRLERSTAIAEGEKTTRTLCSARFQHRLQLTSGTKRLGDLPPGNDSHHATSITLARDSTPPCPDSIWTETQPRRFLSRTGTKESRGSRSKPSLNRFLACWFVALLGSTSSLPVFNVLGLAAAAPHHSALAPSPAYLSSSSSSSSSSPEAHSSSPPWPARYRLVPPSQTNESIFIYFSPPYINNLRVNTRQRVSFNFTVQSQGPRIVSSHSPQFQGTTSTSPESAATTAEGNGAEVAVNDAASDQQLPPTTATVSALNGSHGASELSKTSSSDKSAPIPPPPASSSESRKPLGHRERYRVMIYSDNDIIARPLVNSPGELASVKADARGSYILMEVTAGRTHNFSVEARHIGRVTVSVAVVDVALDKTLHLASEVQAVAATQYPVAAIRGERTADLVFNVSATVIAIIISFGIGAVTEAENIKRQVKYPVSLIIGFCCQFIIMPVMAFGIAMILPLQDYKDIRFGLLCVACVPGGGLGHVAVVIADGDVALSLTLNFISAIAMLITAPLWIFVLGQYFQGDPETLLSSHSVPVFNFEIWLAASFLAYMAGLLIKRLRPEVADAILMWLIKPFLLLASILYITLGVYINMYVFELVNEYALLGAMLLPLCGCVVGALAAAAFRQPYAFVKTIALETCSLNCLVVMVALRYSLEQPDADLAAMIPIWVMFTIPGLFVFLAICNKIKNVIRHYWDQRNGNKKDGEVGSASKAYSVSSSVVSPPGTTTLSAPLVVADGGLDDDLTVSTMSNQKVTVL